MLKDPEEDDLLVEMKTQYCYDKTQEIEAGEKYCCKICLKKFTGQEYVVKHIKNKH